MISFLEETVDDSGRGGHRVSAERLMRPRVPKSSGSPIEILYKLTERDIDSYT